MELQQHLSEFESNDIKLFTVSYDPVEVLYEFATKHAIEYPLLSDEGSKVIQEFGILNTLVDIEEPGFGGIPYPGSYLVDRDGYVTKKFFHREYQVRETAATILHSGFRISVDSEVLPRSTSISGEARCSATIGARDLKIMQRAEIYVRIDLGYGQHINGPMAPPGYFATKVQVTGHDGLRVESPRYPETKPFHIHGLSEEFHVLDGEVEIVVPLILASREPSAGTHSIDDVESVPIEIRVEYQVCDDRECFPPQTERLSLEIPVGQLTGRTQLGG